MAVALLLASTLSCNPLVEHVDKSMLNTVAAKPPYPVSDEVRDMHDRMFVADAHADTLLWDRRGMENSNTYGHIDLPRLQEANVSFQILTVVTKTPASIFSNKRCPPFFDKQLLLTSLQGWPIATWFSPRERAFYQADKWTALCEDPRVISILSREDLDEFQKWRGTRFIPREKRRVATLLGLEGAHALDIRANSSEAEIDHEVREFARRGFRLIGITHRFDNALAYSSEGCIEWISPSKHSRSTGLTAAGKFLVAALNRHHILIDLAHAAPESIDDILALTARPPIISHTGVKAIVNSHRNVSDEHLIAVAKKGGVICIGFWPEAVGGNPTAVEIVNSIDHTVHLLNKQGLDGTRHVGLGSDFDGAVKTAFDVTGVPLITAELKRRGYPVPAIRRIMGLNLAGAVRANLPSID